MTMSRYYIAVFVLSLLNVTAYAAAESEALPEVIAEALNDAAATGNPLVLDAVSERMSKLFPSMQASIAEYTDKVATPAVAVMAAVSEMEAEDAPIHIGLDLFGDKPAAESEAALTAAELNDLAVGMGEFTMEN